MQRLKAKKKSRMIEGQREIFAFTTKFFLMKNKYLPLFPAWWGYCWGGSTPYGRAHKCICIPQDPEDRKPLVCGLKVMSSWWEITHRVRLKHPHLLLGLVNHLPAQFHSLVAHCGFSLSKFFRSTVISDRSRWRGRRLPTSGFVRFVGGRLSCLFDRRSHFWPIQEIFTI